MRKEPNQQGNGACMDCHRAQNFSFWGHKEDRTTMDPMHQKARGIILKNAVLVRSL